METGSEKQNLNNELAGRMDRLTGVLKSLALDGILVSSEANRRYFSGFGGEGYLFLLGERRIFLTDSRYTVAAKRETEGSGCEVFEISRKYEEHFAELIGTGKLRIGYEDKVMVCADYQEISRALPAVTLVPVGDALNRQRAVKSAAEIAWIAKAESIGDLAFSRILGLLKPGMTELAAAAELEYAMKAAGASDVSFSTIVASGINSSMPHAVPSEKKIEAGDFVTMDFGCRYHSYCSDMTRTVVVGKADQKQKEIYGIVLRAQEAACAAMREGVSCFDVDRAARDLIKAAGYGKCFGHSLGHSVGLEIHELPFCSMKSKDLLTAGVTMTSEPGIYMEGWGGVRIEDLLVVTKDGALNLTHSEKQLIEL